MKAIELFVGAGGLGMGATKARFQHAAVIEWDRWACDTLRENQSRGNSLVKHWPIYECDVRDFNFHSIAEDVDLLTAGPPCQPFSMGGKHRSHLDRRDMFPETIRAVRDLAPRAFVVENVKGLTRQSFATYLEYIRLQLRHPEIIAKEDETWTEHLNRLEDYETSAIHFGLHYNIVVRVLNAANFGVPQCRERVFIVGFRADTGIEWHFPSETHSRDALLWSKWRDGSYWDRHTIGEEERVPVNGERNAAYKLGAKPNSLAWVTVRDSLADLPDPEAQPLEAGNWSDHNFVPGARSYAGHTGSPLDAPAKTLKAGVHGVPGGENMLRRPDGTIRYFSVRESARLQTFPDDFVFHGSWSETMRQLGNAVPVLLAQRVVGSVRSALDSSLSQNSKESLRSQFQ